MEILRCFCLLESVGVGYEASTNSEGSINLQIVNQCAAFCKSFTSPEVCKGKGMQYRNEVVRNRQGKR
eukprot:SM000026S08889  [mRNA]  locus=s26:210898:211199:- [translate_table: standard]